MTHTRRDRAESFGEDAAQYDRARPEYPQAFVRDLTGGSPLDVLDAGCGTGKAARAFRAAGCRVLGVQPRRRAATEIYRREAPELLPESGTVGVWDYDAAGPTLEVPYTTYCIVAPLR